MVSASDIQVLALLKTRMSGKKAEKIYKKMAFDSQFHQDPIGFYGGICILWNQAAVEVKIIEVHHQFIHTKLFWKDQNKEELFTVVYGSPRKMERKGMWDSLIRLKNNINGPWALMGDFNAYLRPSEKKGGGEPNWKATQEFQDCLDTCGLADLAFKGPSFTWRRGNLQERLDRAVANEDWLIQFQDRMVSHLNFNGSDHRPIVLGQQVFPRENKGQKPFKFLASWLTYEEFDSIVKFSWEKDVDWISA
ncbi:uncharacterized protein LOC133309482 [Gastrolobium bilobum]|uniref:uncharacterized protein LOC133309482 n=1 Tax=Gastrolobium bilobum TaxID=150636 RepID=UPI002AAF7F65|nr:uncharacterized protein LOC133309482 [Gastrolobium bilobum]